MGNGCWCVSSSIISHWAHDVIATLNVTGVDLTSQQRRVSMGMSPEIIFRGANSTKGFTSPEQNPTSPYHLLLCICKENPLALTIFHQPRVTDELVRICIPDFRSLPKRIWSYNGNFSENLTRFVSGQIRRGMQLFIFICSICICSICFQNQITDTSIVM